MVKLGFYLEDNGYNKTIFEFMQVTIIINRPVYQVDFNMVKLGNVAQVHKI